LGVRKQEEAPFKLLPPEGVRGQLTSRCAEELVALCPLGASSSNLKRPPYGGAKNN